MPWIWGFIFLLLLLVCLSVFFYLSLSRKLERHEIALAIADASSALMKTMESRIKQNEAEWENMYQQFKRLFGRADKVRGLEAPKPEAEIAAAPPMSRAEILRRARSKHV